MVIRIDAFAEVRRFGRHGIEVAICDPRQLVRKDARLWNGNQPIDFVYNRLTDFALNQPGHSAQRLAYLAREVVVSPHPRAHALYADKRNLTLLCDEAFLRETGIADAAVSTLLAAVPRTRIMTDDNRNALWTNRRQHFFKPAAGYGSKAAYRGDKLTKRVWEEMAKGAYVAQALVVQSERHIADVTTPTALKADVRNYAYAGAVKLVAARLYQGQTTNFRTPGGGFAPVFTAVPCVGTACPADCGRAGRTRSVDARQCRLCATGPSIPAAWRACPAAPAWR